MLYRVAFRFALSPAEGSKGRDADPYMVITIIHVSINCAFVPGFFICVYEIQTEITTNSTMHRGDFVHVHGCTCIFMCFCHSRYVPACSCAHMAGLPDRPFVCPCGCPSACRFMHLVFHSLSAMLQVAVSGHDLSPSLSLSVSFSLPLSHCISCCLFICATALHWPVTRVPRPVHDE